MKKLIVLFVAVTMVFAFTACGKSGGSAGAENNLVGTTYRHSKTLIAGEEAPEKGNATLSFAEDGIVTSTEDDIERKGEYSVKGNTVTTTFDGYSTEYEIDGDTLTQKSILEMEDGTEADLEIVYTKEN